MPFRSLVQAELSEDAPDVGFDRLVSHHEPRRDRGIRTALRDQAEDLALTVSESCQGIRLATGPIPWRSRASRCLSSRSRPTSCLDGRRRTGWGPVGEACDGSAPGSNDLRAADSAGRPSKGGTIAIAREHNASSVTDPSPPRTSSSRRRPTSWSPRSWSHSWRRRSWAGPRSSRLRASSRHATGMPGLAMDRDGLDVDRVDRCPRALRGPPRSSPMGSRAKKVKRVPSTSRA